MRLFHTEKKQPTACRDIFWAILFYAHLIAIGYATILYAPMMASDMASGYEDGANRRRQLESVTSFLSGIAFFRAVTEVFIGIVI